jgi:hypothetical protein
VDDIDPLEPVAKYFSFPPGTEVYHKEPAGTRKAPLVTTRIVPGAVAPDDMPEKKQRRTRSDKGTTRSDPSVEPTSG